MSGIIFLKTANMQQTLDFYRFRMGMQLWLTQSHCTILKHGNLLLGFCEGNPPDVQGCYTFFYETIAEIDQKFEEFNDVAETEPRINPDYDIYHFFARDPEGRLVEFQQFLSPMKPYLEGIELLQRRRSIRKFKDEIVPDATIAELMEACRFIPTSMNRQPYYFVLIKEKEKLHKLAQVRSGAMPISKAPMAVAVCIDPSRTKRVPEDAYITAYHFLLAAYSFGLGTCWIADMDRPEVKEMLNIPQDHFVGTVTPLGYPDENPVPKDRRPASELLK